MKLFVLLLAFYIPCTAQNITSAQANKLSKEIIKCIRQNSIYADSLDYDDIEKDFQQYIDTFTSYEKVGWYYTKILHWAGDNHSFYANKKILNNFSKTQKEHIDFSYKLLDGNIGYLNIPAFLSNDKNVVNDFANQIQQAIRELDTRQDIKGWIVDLRSNMGGNMWPMAAGLNPLIGDEIAGYFKNVTKGGMEKWDTRPSATSVKVQDPYKVKNPQSRIAVLYGSKTASSGEAIAICFIGKPNTRSFGSTTAGYTTANNIFNLSDDNIFVLATGFELDRNQKKYTGKLMPDVLLENPDTTVVEEKAKEWIRQQ